MTKVLFRYESNVLDEVVVETMWAEAVNDVDGIYKLDSIPFYGIQLAPGDEFIAEHSSAEGCLVYKRTTKHSGTSVILVVMMDKITSMESIRSTFRSLGCESEGVNDNYFAMMIPQSVDYSSIKLKLQDLEDGGTIEYSEPCLSSGHKNQINKCI